MGYSRRMRGSTLLRLVFVGHDDAGQQHQSDGEKPFGMPKKLNVFDRPEMRTSTCQYRQYQYQQHQQMHRNEGPRRSRNACSEEVLGLDATGQN